VRHDGGTELGGSNVIYPRSGVRERVATLQKRMGTLMSRHKLKPSKPEHQGCEVVVGWDGTLGNFFFEVRRQRDNDRVLCGEAVISRTDFNINLVMEAISEYAVTEPNSDWRGTLWADKVREGTIRSY
jgi:hypothetical protein